MEIKLNYLKKGNKVKTEASNLKHIQYLRLLSFNQIFKRVLIKKKIDVSKQSFDNVNNKLFLVYDLFFQTQKTINYKYKIKKYKKQKKNKKKHSLTNAIKIFNDKISLSVLKFKNLNIEIEPEILKQLYSTTKRFNNILFARRFNLYIDFIKISSLFTQGKITSALFVNYLGLIFYRLPKNKHTRFLFFIKVLFDKILTIKNTQIRGLKFIINGKLQGKTRATIYKTIAGKIPIQTIQSEVLENIVHVYTLYGAFGFKLWTNKIKH
jgi:hypothetical protein